MAAQRCPYCDTWHPTAERIIACSNECFQARVGPLPHELKVAVLQGRTTLAEAEAQVAST